jgi:hypothetical protein
VRRDAGAATNHGADGDRQDGNQRGSFPYGRFRLEAAAAVEMCA